MAKVVRLLLVDDEPDFVDQIAYLLRTKNYEVATVYSGEEAVKAVRKDAPDIVFLDINMPGKDGIETLAELKKIRSGLPVVMVTVVKDEQKFQEATRLGCSGFFPKQGSLEDLQSKKVIQIYP